MKTTIELQRGKIIDLTRFVALIPDEEAKDDKYLLILEGSDRAITLSLKEARLLEEYLNSKDNTIWNPEAQINKNHSAIEFLKKRIAKNKVMSDAESNKRAEFLADFKTTVDKQRGSERKLYSPQ